MVNDVQGWVNSPSQLSTAGMIKSDPRDHRDVVPRLVVTVDGATTPTSNMNLQPILHVEWH